MTDGAGPGPVEAPGEVVQPEITGFRVALANFDGPFDLLLQLINSRKMDVTDRKSVV